MRKYWKTTAIVAVIMLSLGTFYVNAAKRSAENFPSFVIQTLSGNPEEIKSLVLDGSYTDTSSNYYVSSNIKVTARGSVYHSGTFIDQVIGYYPMVIKELQEEYRSFMRSKNTWIESYFENDQFLAYADVQTEDSLRSRDYTFTISVLNKEDESTNSFTVEVPESTELDHVYMEDVQMIDSELYLITRNMMRNNNNSYSTNYIYTIDLENQKISNYESVVQVQREQGNTYTHVQLIGSSPTKANEHLIFQIIKEKVVKETESDRVEEIKQEIISYNLATKEKESIMVSDVSLNENHLSFFDGATLYLTRMDGQELVVTPYHIEEKQVAQAIRIQLSSENGHVHAPSLTVEDGKLYLVSSQMNLDTNADVMVLDLTTGETLFSGKVVLKDSSREKGSFELYLHELFVKYE